MENRKWLKRKYPKNFNKVDKFLNDEQLQIFKVFKFKLGRLTEDTENSEVYSKGTLCMFKRSNPLNHDNYPLHPVTVKCSNNFTISGYNSFWVFPDQVKEVNS